MHIYIDLEQEKEYCLKLRDSIRRLLSLVNQAAAPRHFLVNEIKYHRRTWYGRRYEKVRFLLYERLDEEEVTPVALSTAPGRPESQQDVENYLIGYLDAHADTYYGIDVTAPDIQSDKHWLL